MVDLSDGNVRPFENGPPVSIPMTSTRFDFSSLDRLQVQVLRDLRPTSIDSTLFSLHLGDADRVVDVIETPDGKFLLRQGSAPAMATSIGESSAIVVVIERTSADDEHRFTISARNAETMEALSIELSVRTVTNAMVTVGGPTTEVTSERGRRRLSPIHLEVVAHREPIEQVKRVMQGARRVAGSLRGRGN